MGTWKKIIETRHINVHRVGWFGVWDALKSAITGDDRLIVNRPITLSLYIKTDGNNNYIAGTKLEVGYEQTN